MNEQREIQQIEYRWQPGTDMTAIASSMSDAARQSWSQRLGSSVRHPEVNAPTESVRYAVFGNGMRAALAWRQRDPQAALVTDGPQTRPIVTRVLVGSGQSLPPMAAIALCATGLPEVIGPPLGCVSPGDYLPPISPAELVRLSDAEMDRFDAAAAEEEGLELVIAAALGNLDTPLSVELPEQYIAGGVRGGPQTLLLWGLYATLGTLLGPRFGKRTWSFSTFEPPLGETDPEALGAIVFRASQAAHKSTAPLMFRAEILVRPSQAVPRVAETREQELAQLLVASYRARGARELHQLLDEWTEGCQTSDQRIDAVYRVLVAPPRDGRLGNGRHGNGTGGGAEERTMPRASVLREYASDGPTVVRQALGDAGQTRVPVPAGQPQAELTGERQAEQEGTGEFVTRPALLSELIGYLSGGSRFDFALRAMKAERFSTDPGDRAFARKQLRDHGWYVDILERNPKQHVDDILVMVFMHTVLPDLAQPGTARELTGWAATTSTPTRVIKALYTAGEGTTHEPELAEILAPALGSRWLTEHGISVPPAPGPSSPAARPGRGGGRHAPAPRGESRRWPDKAPELHGAGQSAAAKQGQGSPGPAPRGPAPTSEAPPAADPVPSGPMLPLTMATVVEFLRRRIPVYAALLIAIGVMIVVLVA